MKADVVFGQHEFIGVYGRNEEDIKNKIADEHGLSEYGKSKLIVIERRNEIMLKNLIKEGREFTKEMDETINKIYSNVINNMVNVGVRESSNTLLNNYSFSFIISNHENFKNILKKYEMNNDRINTVLNIKQDYYRECNVEFLYNGNSIKQYENRYPFILDIIPELIRRAIIQSTSNPNLDDILEEYNQIKETFY